MSSSPITARCSFSAQMTERRTSSATVALPTTTLPRASARRMRSWASQDPMSSQRNVPVTTARRRVRSSTATLGDLDGERASRGDRDRRHDRGAGERPHAGDADRSRGPPEGTGAGIVTHALHMLDPDPSPAWAPFAGIRPLSELRVGASLVRERWEAFVGAETTAIFALPHLAGFREPGVPAVVAVRPVEGPVVVGASAFAPPGLAPAFPAGDARLAHPRRTAGGVVRPGPTWAPPPAPGP